MARRKTGPSWAPTVRDRAGRQRRFEQLVATALDELPEEFRRRLDNVEVVIEEAPGREELLGLYHGIPQTERGMGYAGVLPDKITIYRQPIERRSRDAADLAREIRVTVLHEIAHHFGISDERLHQLGWD